MKATSDCATPPFRECQVIRNFSDAKRVCGDCGNRSLVGLLEDRLDLYIYTLMNDWVGKPPVNEAEQSEIDQLKGRAQGITEALALLTNPHHPDQERIKAAAMVRYEERMEEEDGD